MVNRSCNPCVRDHGLVRLQKFDSSVSIATLSFDVCSWKMLALYCAEIF